MARPDGRGLLLSAAVVFAVFAANVLAGALGEQPFFPDIAEMLTLFLACGLFVAGVLRRESAGRCENTGQGQSPGKGGKTA